MCLYDRQASPPCRNLGWFLPRSRQGGLARLSYKHLQPGWLGWTGCFCMILISQEILHPIKWKKNIFMQLETVYNNNWFFYFIITWVNKQISPADRASSLPCKGGIKSSRLSGLARSTGPARLHITAPKYCGKSGKLQDGIHHWNADENGQQWITLVW